jgi:hypothetical protein
VYVFGDGAAQASDLRIGRVNERSALVGSIATFQKQGGLRITPTARPLPAQHT